MNNVFDIKRFFRYARMNYLYNKGQYLGTIGVVAFVLFWKLCNFNLLAETYKGYSSGLNRLMDDFTLGFYMWGALFVVFIIKVSMRGINGQSLSMQDMLIPVSTFERYIFAILNSTVVATVVYVIIFQVVSTYVESMYLFSEDGHIFTGILGVSQEVIESGGYTQECHISLWEVVSNGIVVSKIPTSVVVSSLLLIYTTFISAFMWGEITFRNRWAVLLTFLSHMAVVVVAIAIFQIPSYDMLYSVPRLHIVSNHSEFFEQNIIYFICALYMLPITYQWVVWKKFKNLSVTK